VSGRSRAESQVGVRLMGVWRVSYSNIQEIFFTFVVWLVFGLRSRSMRACHVMTGWIALQLLRRTLTIHKMCALAKR
jgi:hypothetical protein